MKPVDGVLCRAPWLPLAGQVVVLAAALTWFAILGALPLWAGAAILGGWIVRGRRRSEHLRRVIAGAAPGPDAPFHVGRRHVARVAKVLARRAGRATPMIAIMPGRVGHNLTAQPVHNTLFVSAPTLTAIEAGGLTGPALAGIVSHEIAHLALARPWHHADGALRATLITSWLVATPMSLVAGHGFVLSLVSIWPLLAAFTALDHVVSQGLELQADRLAATLAGSTEGLSQGMAILTILDVLAFEPLPPDHARRFAAELRVFGHALGDAVRVSGQPLETLAARVDAHCRPARTPFLIRQALSLLLGEWPTSHPGPGRRLALLEQRRSA